MCFDGSRPADEQRRRVPQGRNTTHMLMQTGD